MAYFEEIFGPVLHLATYKARDLDRVIGAINATGYGLTFGLMTRIDDRVQHVTEAVHAGNIYVNRNQIGAIVGSQPFGGEGLSGTGPKAGGPLYVRRFMKARVAEQPVPAEARRIDASQARKLISEVESRAVPAPEARQAVPPAHPPPSRPGRLPPRRAAPQWHPRGPAATPRGASVAAEWHDAVGLHSPA